MARKKVRESWTEKHHNVVRKIFLERSSTKKRPLDIEGRIPVSVKLARWRKAQKSTGSTTVRNGTH